MKNKFKVLFFLLLLVIAIGLLVYSIANKGPKIVGGENHIYKGQKLDEKWLEDREIVELSPRASYLKTTVYLDSEAKPFLEQMILDAEKDGMCLVVGSGYRSFNRQKVVYDKTEDKSLVALPGESEHQTGLAVDFYGCPMIDGVRNDVGERLELIGEFEDLPEYDWLVANAGKYNFEESFRVDNQEITGYPPEPWHWKFLIQ